MKLWEKITTFLKKHWQYVVLFFGGIIGLLTIWKKPESGGTKTLRDQRDKQLDDIDKVRAGERSQQDAADKKLENDLASIEQQYEQNKKELDDKKKDQIKTILKEHGDDPVGLAKKLSDVTGFRVIMPEE